MKIYFDESEDSNKTLLLVGCICIIGDQQINYFRDGINKIKNDNNFFDKKGSLREIKYSKIWSPTDIKVAKQSIDLFFSSNKAYFRCIVLEWDKNNLSKVGKKNQSNKLKKAILYTKLTVKLLTSAIGDFRNIVLLYDELVRCTGDKFEQMIEEKFGYSTNFSKIKTFIPKIKIACSVKSNLELNNSVQLTDLLTGCILNNNKPSSKNKNKVRNYLIRKIGCSSLLRDNWKNKSCNNDPEKTKFYIEYYTTDSLLKSDYIYKKRKNRSR